MYLEPTVMEYATYYRYMFKTHAVFYIAPDLQEFYPWRYEASLNDRDKHMKVG